MIARHSGWPLRAVPSWPPAAKGLWCELHCRHRVLQITKQLLHGDGVRVGLRQREICRWGPENGAMSTTVGGEGAARRDWQAAAQTWGGC